MYFDKGFFGVTQKGIGFAMLVSKFILTPLSSLGLCDAKLEGYQGESAPLFLCVHPNNCPCGVFAVHAQLNNNGCNYLSLIKHFPSTLSLVVFFWASTRTAMNSINLPLLTYPKWSNNLFLHYTPVLCCLSWDYQLYLDWDHVTHRQASHREWQGRKGNTLISQVIVLGMSLFQHCFLSKIFLLKSIISCV